VTTVISIYALTCTAPDEARLDFYSSRSAAVSSVPAHNILLILDVFNCRLGTDVTKHSYLEETNCSGELLWDLMEEHALLACNTQFQKKRNKLWYWHSPPDAQKKVHKQQIDYILVRWKWGNRIHDAHAYNSFASIGSDHRVVTARIQLSLKAPKAKSARKIKYIWKVLEGNAELQEQYAIWKVLEGNAELQEQYVWKSETNSRYLTKNQLQSCMNVSLTPSQKQL